jgi:hypothetical protein
MEDNHIDPSEWTSCPQLISMTEVMVFLSDVQECINRLHDPCPAEDTGSTQENLDVLQVSLDKFRGEMLAIKHEVMEEW